jgi:hypothetical protein
MKKRISRTNKYHDFIKQNLVTIMDKSGLYDIYKCSNCGLTGKCHGLGQYVEVDGRTSEQKIKFCNKKPNEAEEQNVGRTIVITFCNAQGKIFSNLTPNSEHVVIATPSGEEIKDNGVWVTGVGEPVKVLNNEFKFKQ